ncbi:hypothetical protein ABZX30_19720 [Streptomyces sp. NPDC004542]|uniref:hypothetical protein n=1 Tax=Streptomyces sp. NPDC004542 TaxID=3154281 RepID=UPI0033A3D3F9
MDAREEAARGLEDIGTFLYREAHLQAAHRRVAEFTARATGLTREQKGEIERWYLDEQRYVARMVTQHIADSISTAEQRQHARIGRWLTGTLTAMALITAALIVVSVVVILGATH